MTYLPYDRVVNLFVNQHVLVTCPLDIKSDDISFLLARFEPTVARYKSVTLDHTIFFVQSLRKHDQFNSVGQPSSISFKNFVKLVDWRRYLSLSHHSDPWPGMKHMNRIFGFFKFSRWNLLHLASKCLGACQRIHLLFRLIDHFESDSLNFCSKNSMFILQRIPEHVLVPETLERGNEVPF